MKTMDLTDARNEMVKHQIAGRGVKNRLVLDAMRKVPREAFLAEHFHELAYDDTPLPIAANQTISQPYIVAYMIESLGLKGGERVLEIGAGSGYAAAILAEIADEVFTVDRIAELAEKATATLRSINCLNVRVLHGDGTQGWPEHAPYDAIIVAAGGPRIPESLKSQLKIGGRMVIPVGLANASQQLLRITRISETNYQIKEIADVRFVPLIGEEGWQDEDEREAI